MTMLDVAVIGAGPGGSTCARLCAQSGLNTLLLDKDVFPRLKPCEGAVSARALTLLDFPLAPELIEAECFGVRFRYGEHVVESKISRRIAALVSREAFDHHLADKAAEAGALFRQGERVAAVSMKKDRVEVAGERTAHEARYVVGADGANSVTARSVRPLFPRDEILAALVGRVPADERKCERRIRKNLKIALSMARMLEKHPRAFLSIFSRVKGPGPIPGHRGGRERLRPFPPLAPTAASVVSVGSGNETLIKKGRAEGSLSSLTLAACPL